MLYVMTQAVVVLTHAFADVKRNAGGEFADVYVYTREGVTGSAKREVVEIVEGRAEGWFIAMHEATGAYCWAEIPDSARGKEG